MVKKGLLFIGVIFVAFNVGHRRGWNRGYDYGYVNGYDATRSIAISVFEHLSGELLTLDSFEKALDDNEVIEHAKDLYIAKRQARKEKKS